MPVRAASRERDTPIIKRGLSPLFIQVFYPLNTLVQTHCDCAQDDDGGDNHVELEEMEGANDKKIYAEGRY